MKLPKEIKSDFAILDVKSGRKILEKYFEKRKPNGTPINKPIKVIIDAEICGQWGGDDGVSVEFEMNINNIKIRNEEHTPYQQRIINALDTHRLSQAALARLLGISQSDVSRYVNGLLNPTKEVMATLKNKLKM